MYVNRVHIENLRCFVEADLQLQHLDRQDKAQPLLEFPNINLLLGNNGSGKSTVLKAIALAALAPVMVRSSGYKPYRLVRRTAMKDRSQKAAEIKVGVLLHKQDWHTSRPPKETTANFTVKVVSFGDEEWLETSNQMTDRRWRDMFNNNSPAFLVLGYGTTRRVDDSPNFDAEKELKRRSLRYLRVVGLFESNVPLIPLHSWLPHLKSTNPGRYKQVVNLLDRLLPDEASFTGDFDGSEYYFETRGADLPFAALSDGYRGYIGWIADLLYHICKGCPKGVKLIENQGIVLVDEIDLLLHPEWQRTVLQTLSRTLPNLQFIFSTHSPIIAGSVHRENIYVMEVDSSGAATVEQYKERIYGLNAEQILTSSYFGLRTTRAASFVDQELRPLTEKALGGDRQAAVSFVQKLAGERDGDPARKAPSAISLPRIDDEKFKAMLEAYQAQSEADDPKAVTKTVKRAAAKKSIKRAGKKPSRKK